MKTDSFKYLVNLDVLLDARLGAVSLLNPTFGAKLLREGWTKRKDDKSLAAADDFNYDAYSELLRKGSVDVLKHSLPTLMTNYIYSLIRDAHNESVIGNTINDHYVVVNVYPYPLDADEQKELVDILELKIPNASGISVTSIPQHFLTPSYLRSNEITHFINYDLGGWLNLFVEVLMKDPIPSITMVCPKLLTKNVEDTEDPESTSKLMKEMSPFTAMEMQFLMYIAIRFIDVGYFSVLLPD